VGCIEVMQIEEQCIKCIMYLALNNAIYRYDQCDLEHLHKHRIKQEKTRRHTRVLQIR